MVSNEVTPCDICSSWEAMPVEQSFKYGSGGVYVCRGCGFVYVRNRRSFEEIANSWDEIYGEGYTSNWPAVHARLHYVAEWFEQTNGWDGKSVLEIGAGEGKFLDLVRGYGAHPVGIEPSAENCQKIRQKDIMAHHGTIEKCGTVGTFDVVAILWTLENCQDCIGMLKLAHKNLAADGILLVATGSRIMVPFKKPIETYFSHNPPDTHCFRFSAISLANAVSRAGFGNQMTFNEYSQSDWMILTTTKGPTVPAIRKENPEHVLRFFDDWERCSY